LEPVSGSARRQKSETIRILEHASTASCKNLRTEAGDFMILRPAGKTRCVTGLVSCAFSNEYCGKGDISAIVLEDSIRLARNFMAQNIQSFQEIGATSNVISAADPPRSYHLERCQLVERPQQSRAGRGLRMPWGTLANKPQTCGARCTCRLDGPDGDGLQAYLCSLLLCKKET
jgi:hypothetical protein